MSTITEQKSVLNEENNQSEQAYSVEENDDTENNQFSNFKPRLLRTPSVLNAIIDQLHPEIIAKSHQSNFVLFPPKLEGCTIVDLGCGIGRDVFILSKLVGDNGRVIGIDSEKDKLDFARQHVDYHITKFGLKKSNIEFIQGEIDELDKINFNGHSIDVVVSNSIINHRKNKKLIIEGVCKILKPGGEFFFSDVYSNEQLSKEHEELLSNEYIGGAIQWEDLILYATEAGLTQPRLVTAQPITIESDEIAKITGKIKFVSAIFRCFKLPLNDKDSMRFNIPYQLTYETPLTNSEEEFFFDHSIQFKIGELIVIDDPSIALELNLSRYKDNFNFDPIQDTNDENIEDIPSPSQTNNNGKTHDVYNESTTTTIRSND